MPDAIRPFTRLFRGPANPGDDALEPEYISTAAATLNDVVLKLDEGFLISRHFLYYQFYDADGDVVTPTAGRIHFDGGWFEDQWLSVPTLGSTGNDVTEADYDVPAFSGAIQFIRPRVVEAITGAPFIRITYAGFN